MSRVVNPRVGKPAPLLLLSFALVWQLALRSPSNIDRAKECFEAYAEAMQQGRVEEAKGFWNDTETKSYEMYDWQWAYLSFTILNPRHLNYKITDSEEREGYIVLEVEWYYREGKAGHVQRDTRYFIEQDGRMVGANPILIQTRGWLRKESEYFVYQYKDKEDKPTGALLQEMDAFYEETVDRLQVDYRDKIDYFKCESSEEVGLLFGLEPSLARNQMINGVVASVQRFVPHEIVHVISYRALPQGEKSLPPEYLSEGLAYYLGGASFFSSQLLLSWAKKKLEAEEGVFLDSLIRNPWVYGENEGAGLLSSLVKFLIDAEGISQFKQLFAAGEGYVKQGAALKEIYGKATDRLQREWREFVLGLQLPEIKVGNSGQGGKVFHIEDPPGDDKGDGDYKYPENKRALSGIFDLTGFEVSFDDQLTYFKLQFANLNQERASSDEAFNGTFAVIALDLDNKKNSGSTRLFFDNGGLEFSQRDGFEFAIEVSNAGILVYDQNWVWHLLFLEAVSQQSHIRGNEIRFGVPQEIIPIRDLKWKVQVLTGGQEGGYMNTAYGVGKFMKVGELPAQDQGGGGTNTDLSPDVYDILTPQGTDQVKILGDYDLTEKRRAIIPMVRLK